MKNCRVCCSVSKRICKHGRGKQWCQLCKARLKRGLEKDICRPYKYKATSGTPRCQHDRIRRKCHDCKRAGTGGELICDHYRERLHCSECKATGTGAVPMC